MMMRAEPANADEKERLWPLLTKTYGRYDDYQAKTKREIPVVVLHRDDRLSARDVIVGALRDAPSDNPDSSRPTPNAPMRSFQITRIAGNPMKPATAPDAGGYPWLIHLRRARAIPRNKRFITSQTVCCVRKRPPMVHASVNRSSTERS